MWPTYPSDVFKEMKIVVFTLEIVLCQTCHWQQQHIGKWCICEGYFSVDKKIATETQTPST